LSPDEEKALPVSCPWKSSGFPLRSACSIRGGSGFIRLPFSVILTVQPASTHIYGVPGTNDQVRAAQAAISTTAIWPVLSPLGREEAAA
jgi:hypothetical protein